MVELGALYREITGRRFPVVPCPGAVMRGLGRLNDSLSRVLPIDTPITTEAMEIFTRWPDVDDRATRADLGIDYRPLADTLRDTIRALHRADRVSARHAGRLAT
jgi:hypothetical protein